MYKIDSDSESFLHGMMSEITIEGISVCRRRELPVPLINAAHFPDRFSSGKFTDT